MQLIGYMDSPYVRRVAVTAELLSIPCEHLELSVFRDYEALRNINPQVKVPTLVLDDGRILVNFLLENGPADAAGIQLGTEIVDISGILQRRMDKDAQYQEL